MAIKDYAIKVYGASDDLVEIEGSSYKENEIGCFENDVRIRFTDGTVIRVGYPKDGLSVWWIEVEKTGKAYHFLEECVDENAQIYSDCFYIDAEIKSHSVIKQKYPERE